MHIVPVITTHYHCYAHGWPGNIRKYCQNTVCGDIHILFQKVSNHKQIGLCGYKNVNNNTLRLEH